MTYVEEEIASQPDCWSTAARALGSWADVLPAHGERLAVVGCGTSLFMAQCFAALRESAGLGETDAFAASELPHRRYDRVLALTRSGTTTEVLDALRALRGTVPTVAITGVPQPALRELADEVVTLDFADERSIVQTRFATSALVLLRAHLGFESAELIDQAAEATTAELPAGAIKRSQFTFIGRGWTVGLAHEAALKLREAAGSWTESYPAMEYRHGPISITDERSLVWSLGTPPRGLAEEVERAGGLWLAAKIHPLAELVRVQRLAVALAHEKGVDPDQPRNLNRSVILEPGAGGGSRP